MATSFDLEAEPIEFENLAKLVENIVYLLPGCSSLVIRKTLQEVYRDFCRRACCLRARRHFELKDRFLHVSPTFGGAIDCIASVHLDGRKLREGIDYRTDDGARCTVIINERFVPEVDDGTRRVVLIETIEVPGLTSEQVPCEFVEKYGEYLVSGTLARIQMINGRPWSDPSQSTVNMSRYENGVNDARVKYYCGSGNSTGDVNFYPDDPGLI